MNSRSFRPCMVKHMNEVMEPYDAAKPEIQRVRHGVVTFCRLSPGFSVCNIMRVSIKKTFSYLLPFTDISTIGLTFWLLEMWKCETSFDFA